MDYEYEVALSFAGEQRPFAEAIAEVLVEAGVKVFYDDFYAEEQWGEDLSVKLREVYHDRSQFCIMIVSKHYVEKMWPSFERQQAIERLIEQKGQSYVLPVRLDGFAGQVPGLSGTIGYLSVTSSEHQKVVEAFLRKAGRKVIPKSTPRTKREAAKPKIPKLKRQFTDKEKNQLLKSSFQEVMDLLEDFAAATHQEHPHFEYEKEMLASRKAVFTLYENEKRIAQFKLVLGGMFGENSIAFSYGSHVDIENDSSMNESISLEEYEGELKLKPLGLANLGAEKDKPMSPRDVAGYLWKLVCEVFS